MGLFSNKNTKTALMLDEEDFKCLVRGGVLLVNDNLKIALQDFGFERMEKAIELAVNGIDIYKNRNRETNDGKGYE